MSRAERGSGGDPSDRNTLRGWQSLAAFTFPALPAVALTVLSALVLTDRGAAGDRGALTQLIAWVSAGSVLTAAGIVVALRTLLPRALWRQVSPWSSKPLPLPKAIDDLRHASPYLSVMSEQLGGALATNGQGVEDLVALLDQLQASSNDVQDRVSQSTTNALKLLEIVHEKVSMDRQLRLILEMFVSRQEQDNLDNLGRIERLRKVKGLADLVEIIASVARQTNFLAINASIEAARAGPAGRGFAVIAGEIRSLSTEAASAATKITAQIEAATDRIDEELGSVQQAAARGGSTGSMQRVLQDIDAMQARFNEAAQATHIETVFNDLAQGHAAMVALLTEAFGKIQFQDVMRQRVEQVRQAIGEFDGHLLSMADLLADGEQDGPAYRTLKERLEDQVGSYVMQDQRDAHGATTGSAPAPVARAAPAAPAIELF